ncbi:Serpin B9 [Cricetulus griseus]|uniref:Serpin B9 n=1 Tax=Cricetulus griseus TaxID=10029 RepID=G3GWY1_CRIGR|nr:Serpin B9 [Cricetulus griseus]
MNLQSCVEYHFSFASRLCIMTTVCEANGSFAIHLLKTLCQNNPSKNVCYSPVSISSALAMVLLGAKGDTAAQITQKEKQPVQMMRQKDTFHLAYVNEVQAQVLLMPYEGMELSMVVLLPDDGVDLSKVENSLTFEKLTAWTRPYFMKSTDVEVFLPKFKLQEDYDMGSVLQRLTMMNVFQEDKADLSGMSPEKDLCLSQFIHKSVVEVNEEGTEAAAASATISVDCADIRHVSTFCADHPFLFFIRHKETNSLLFCGRFSSP